MPYLLAVSFTLLSSPHALAKCIDIWFQTASILSSNGLCAGFGSMGSDVEYPNGEA